MLSGSKRNQQLKVNVEFQSSKEEHKDDKPLQDVFEIILHNIKVNELVNNGDG